MFVYCPSSAAITIKSENVSRKTLNFLYIISHHAYFGVWGASSPDSLPYRRYRGIAPGPHWGTTFLTDLLARHLLENSLFLNVGSFSRRIFTLATLWCG